MSLSHRSNHLSSSSGGLSLGQFGGTFLLLNALSSKISGLLGDTVSTIIKGYERHGILGLVRSKEFKRLLKRYTWLVALALAFERASWLAGWLGNIGRVSRYLHIDALLKPGDEAYDWILHYWESTNAFNRSRDFVIETGSKTSAYGGWYGGGRMSRRVWNSMQSTSIFDPYSAPGDFVDDKLQTRVSPKDNDEQWIWHKKTLFRLQRFQRMNTMTHPDGSVEPISYISIRSFSFSRSPLFSLLNAAKDHYETSLPSMVTIKILDNRGSWRKSTNRHKRPLNSIIMDDSKRKDLLADAKEFLSAETWYATRGIAWRRGYLLHGSPGTGKSSTIQALASEVKLDVYCININSSSMSDGILSAALRSIPSRSIVVIEDIDASFSIENRQLEEQQNKQGAASLSALGENGTSKRKWIKDQKARGIPVGTGGASSQLSLSSILNAIDGVESNEGRLLFMTTNASLDTLDSALIRPGRVDMFISYTRATKQQAIDLFKNFYTPASSNSSSSSRENKDSQALSASNVPGSSNSSHPFELPLDITSVQIASMASEWASYLKDEQFSVAELQGQLLSFKKDPEQAVRKMEEWVREKLKEKEQADNEKNDLEEDDEEEIGGQEDSDEGQIRKFDGPSGKTLDVSQ